MKDGLATVELFTQTASGTNAAFTYISGTESIVAAELGVAACSGVAVSLEYPVVYTGSPIRPNNAMQYGTAVVTGNSGTVISFGKPFASTPIIFLQPMSGAQPYLNGASAGSCVVIVPAGSGNIVTYFAIGSGRI